MRIASFRAADGPGYGVVEGEDLHPAGAAFRARYPGVRHVLAGGALTALAAEARGAAPLPLAGLRLLPPVPRAGKIIGVGLNYPKIYPAGDGPTVQKPAHIVLFAKYPETLLGHGAPLVVPAGEAAATFDYEGELAVVIGRPGRDIPPAQAYDHVAGYTVLNDGSVRGWQTHSVHAGKNFAGSGACGPWLVTADAVGAPEGLRLTTRLNGEVVQDAKIAEMFYSIPEIIAYVSHTIPLAPGDIIATGSPDGSGGSRTPRRFLHEFDRLEITIDRIGTLANTVGGLG